MSLFKYLAEKSASGSEGKQTLKSLTLKTLAPTAEAQTAESSAPTEIRVSGDAMRDQAAVTRAQQADFDKRFAPLEQRLIETIQGDGEAQADKASADITKQAGITRETFMRDLARSGTQVTARQNSAIERSRGLDLARGRANAENMTRRRIKDEYTQATADMIGLGRDVQQGVNRDLSSASSMQASRESAGAAAKQAHSAQQTSTVMSIAGLAAAAFL